MLNLLFCINLVLIKYFIFLAMFLILLWVEIVIPESCHPPVSLRIGRYSLVLRTCLQDYTSTQMHISLNTYYRLIWIS